MDEDDTDFEDGQNVDETSLRKRNIKPGVPGSKRAFSIAFDRLLSTLLTEIDGIGELRSQRPAGFICF